MRQLRRVMPRHCPALVPYIELAALVLRAVCETAVLPSSSSKQNLCDRATANKPYCALSDSAQTPLPKSANIADAIHSTVRTAAS